MTVPLTEQMSVSKRISKPELAMALSYSMKQMNKFPYILVHVCKQDVKILDICEI